jgi:hypothetical protein
MRFRHLARATLPGLCTLSVACADGHDPTTAPLTAEAGGTDAIGANFTLFGLGGLGPGCRATAYRGLDFWVGTWQVTAGVPVPTASFVSSELDGCAIQEEWHGGGGVLGRSLNVYDASDRQWHQHWVESVGFFPLRLDGGVVEGRVTMQETYPDPFGSPTSFTDRYTWFPDGMEDMHIRIEKSTDGGATILSTNNLVYHRAATPVVPQAQAFPFCTDPALSLFQEFDFTVGTWEVSVDRPDAGSLRSEIRHDLDGCLISERLSGPSDYQAMVFTNIRPIDEVWRRTYIDNRGLRIYLTGPRRQSGEITLSGTMPGPDRAPRAVRATFAAVGRDRFVERWEVGGPDDWAPLLTATYRRR